MSIVTQNRRYLPHEITTKIHAVESYRKLGDISYICRKYKISKETLNKANYRATEDSSYSFLTVKILKLRLHSPQLPVYRGKLFRFPRKRAQ